MNILYIIPGGPKKVRPVLILR